MVGIVVSHYRLEREIGRGSFGVVYEAIDIDDPSFRVAVKLIHPMLANDGEFLSSLRRERILLNGLNHPGVVGLRDLVVGQGTAALLLELLDGTDLHRLARAAPVPVPTAVAILEQAMDALAFTHARGIAHRDLKPANMFWTRRGELKLMDFGLAKALDGTVASNTGHFTGTYSYAAPEVWDGQPATPAVDTYALGLVAWELLAGTTACPDGPMPVKMRWHERDAPAPLRSVRGDVPAWLEGWVAACVEKRAADRPAHGGAALALWRRLKLDGASATGAAAAGTALPGAAAPPPEPMGATNPRPAPPEASVRAPVAAGGAPALPPRSPAPEGSIRAPTPPRGAAGAGPRGFAETVGNGVATGAAERSGDRAARGKARRGLGDAGPRGRGGPGPGWPVSSRQSGPPRLRAGHPRRARDAGRDGGCRARDDTAGARPVQRHPRRRLDQPLGGGDEVDPPGDVHDGLARRRGPGRRAPPPTR